MQWFLKKIIGTKNERDVKKLRPLVARVNELEQQLQSLSEDELKAKTLEFKERLTKGQTTDDILCEAFAVVKNACRRLCGTTIDVCGRPMQWDMVPFDVQIIGGIVLHQGKIAEMATGEGKTLVATMPAYLNALTGENVHVVTVNDYLAKRDSEWMGAVYRYLGLTVGCIQNQMPPEERRKQYACDITYGTNSEFGFDYLRDKGMAYRPEEMVQRGYFYAIIDEVDSILIDEARTPLIISGPAPYSTNQYNEVKPAVERLVRRQRDLCNRLVQDAKKLIEEKKEEEGAAQALPGPPGHAEEQAAPAPAGGARHPAPAGEDRILLPDRHAQGRGARASRGTLFHDRREGQRREPDRKGLRNAEPERSGHVRSARPRLGPGRARWRQDADRRAEVREAPGDAESVRGPQRAHPRRGPADPRLLRLREGRPVRRPGQPGHHRGRVHRPPDARPPLERRPAPGRRGQGRRRASSAKRRRWRRSRSRTTSACTRSSRA